MKGSIDELTGQLNLLRSQITGKNSKINELIRKVLVY